MRLTAAITHEAPWYVARCCEVEVASQGEAIESAIDNLTEALALHFEHGTDEVPESPAIITPVELAG